MARVTKLQARNFRSIGGWVEVDFPENGPLVLIGENNAGKSNIVRALDIVLGETWPGSFNPEDHDYYQRVRDSVPMQILVNVEGIRHIKQDREVAQISWRYDPDEDRACAFDAMFLDGPSAWMGNAEREQLACVVVGADRRLSYQLSYTSKWTLLSRLMRRFHDVLIQDDDRAGRLRDQFSSIVDIFKEVEEFKGFSEGLRRMAGEFGANLNYALEMDFSAYDPSNYFRSLRVQPTSDGEVRSFDELGTGQEQILALAFAHAYAMAYGAGEAGLVMVIEEPEAHLHPLAQQWLSRKIHTMSGDGVQVVVTTHSPAFLDLAHVDGIACTRKPDETTATAVVQHDIGSLVDHCRALGADKADEDNLASFYAASATEELKSGLFARACVVVEGPTEALALPLLLEACGVDVLKAGVAVVSAGGIGSIARWVRLYTAYGIPTYVVFDADSKDDKDGVKRADLLTSLGENPAAWVVPDEASVVTGTYCVMAPDFETALRAMFPDVYAGFEEKARQTLGSNKPIVAREACKHLAGVPELNGWTALRVLADSIRALLPVADPVDAPAVAPEPTDLTIVVEGEA